MNLHSIAEDLDHNMLYSVQAAALKILDTDRPAVKVSVRHAVVTPRPDSLLWESSDWDLTNCPCSLLSLHPCDQSLRQSAAGPGPRFTRSRPLGGV